MVDADRFIERILAFDPPGLRGEFSQISNDGLIDRARFAYARTDCWRVRHNDGREIIVIAGDSWERDEAWPAWRHITAEGGAGVHHNAALVTMVRPRLLAPFVAGVPYAVSTSRPIGDLVAIRLLFDDPECSWMEMHADLGGLVRRLEGPGGNVFVVDQPELGPVPAEIFQPYTPDF